MRSAPEVNLEVVVTLAPERKERLQRAIARWFVLYGIGVVPVAAGLVYLASTLDQAGGGSPCTGPLGACLALGLRAVAWVVAVWLLGTGVQHFRAGRRFLAGGAAGHVRRVCWSDAVFWLFMALLLGPGLGPVVLAGAALLCGLHVLAALLFGNGASQGAPASESATS